MDEIKNKILCLWGGGCSINEICRAIPLKEGKVRAIIKDMRDLGELGERPSKSKITKDKVISLYKSGVKSPYEIADCYGLSVVTVRNILSHASLHRGRPKHNYKKREPRAYERLCDNTKTIIDMLSSGMSVRQVSRELDVSTQWVHIIRTKYVKKGGE